MYKYTYMILPSIYIIRIYLYIYIYAYIYIDKTRQDKMSMTVSAQHALTHASERGATVGRRRGQLQLLNFNFSTHSLVFGKKLRAALTSKAVTLVIPHKKISNARFVKYFSYISSEIIF